LPQRARKQAKVFASFFKKKRFLAQLRPDAGGLDGRQRNSGRDRRGRFFAGGAVCFLFFT
jgi:hypothetical protein